MVKNGVWKKGRFTRVTKTAMIRTGHSIALHTSGQSDSTNRNKEKPRAAATGDDESVTSVATRIGQCSAG